ncbi:uncharacterized protein MELLADRAFT_100976 [Melampsora larici-populina 98AG31]|uniref:Uncharacterized protein n=1 Tax=Melampsora larici-populina (strain 98AG31 / pathotype 3-4-7) TaxID=747676 RepID=F4R368_MELLP|nr:uncharacterized protein MELLADRAFT_100976 [Melampsora larici-populina 98AG31]EGG13222.1 hypothetical protein MELLADRAFT_100976 [Melampsora larici-populina 98AG31]
MILDKNGDEETISEQPHFPEQPSKPNEANLGSSYDLSHPIVHHALEKQHKDRHDCVDLAKMLSEAGVLYEITMSPEQYIQAIDDVVSNDSNPWKDHLYEGHYSHLFRLITMAQQLSNGVRPRGNPRSKAYHLQTSLTPISLRENG